VELIPEYTTISGMLFLLAWMLFVAQGLISWLIYRRLAGYAPSHGNEPPEPVSVVICSRNNAEGLEKNLPAVLQQNYTELEVIVVNDNSEDHTRQVLQAFQQKYPRLKIVSLTEKKHPGKKQALTEGIHHAQYEWIVVTDSDCRPVSENWIAALMREKRTEKALLLGYGAYKKKPGLLNKLVRFDTVQIAMQYMGLALLGKPYMGVGRNMAYRRSLFESVNGLQSHWDVASGDDDLFVQQAANANNAGIVLSPESFTVSQPKETFGAWVRQKARHISAAGKYKRSFRGLLGLIPLINLLFYLAVFTLAFSGNPLPALLWIGLRAIFLYIFYLVFLGKFHEKDLILYVPLLDLIYTFVLPVFMITNLLAGSRKWN
jgi:cellulose synthase/poly-beta-1,6-N-acetylglucosamine synthase-like glycosyltransferase